MIIKNQLKALLMSLLIWLMSQGCTAPPVTLTPPPTQEKPAQILDLSQMNVNEWASTSLDGKWVAAGLVALPKANVSGQHAYVRLMIFSADGKTHWTVLENWQEIGLGFPMPVPLRWSKDSKHFYFSHSVTPDGCSTFPWLTDLQRVSLEDGAVKDLLPASALALALAPDDSQIAYIDNQKRGLVLRDLVTREERETRIDPGQDFNAGNILWSPDGKSLTLTLAIKPCTGANGNSKTVGAESTTILWVDAKTLQQRILLQEDPRLFITLDWKEPEKITVADGKEDALWYLDVNTGEISRQ